ncbi:family 16 glycosylhydrolase [Salipiger abyssi]|uniref:family 16 glycosylhydrolase n=1 Tax=Salipiger abyssi TaxID=1250539 RepID=UPI001A8FE25C|nr:family 16 glycosylhydrolase [Salipiger abyssi]MBN9886272.1 family 16 glycosylhydrolase [Salipiger abyssi]
MAICAHFLSIFLKRAVLIAAHLLCVAAMTRHGCSLAGILSARIAMLCDMHRFFTSVIAALIVSIGGGVGCAAETITPMTEAYQTDFRRLESGRWYISNGWSNGDHQNCTWSRRAIALEQGGGLRVRYMPASEALPEALCGELQTRMWFLYGTFEARLRGDLGSGRNAAFFAYTGPVHGQPHDEIDFEMLTRESGLMWLNRYVAGNDFGEGKESDFEPGAEEGYVDLAFVWEPDRLRWYINGELRREETRGIPSHPMKIYFSHWGSDILTSWMGPFDPPDGPVEMKVSSFSYTPMGQRCVFPDSITCELP